MSSVTIISAAVLFFIVAAFLYYQSRSGSEGFENSGNVAGRPFNRNNYDKVPADLAQAPKSNPDGTIPQSSQKPVGIPGGGAPREAKAGKQDIQELIVQITTWLEGATRQETDEFMSLTPTQRDQRIKYQSRREALMTQLETGMIEETYAIVAAETLRIRKENDVWRRLTPSIDRIQSFGLTGDPNAYLTRDQFDEFYSLFNAALKELTVLVQPDSIQRVRIMQLQVIRQELGDTIRRGETPVIQMAAASRFLQTMLKADQPLPTLISMGRPPAAVEEADDVLRDIRNMRVDLIIMVDPASQQIKAALDKLTRQLSSKEIRPCDARSYMAELKNRRAESFVGGRPINPGGWNPEENPLPDWVVYEEKPVLRPSYDPKNLIKRAHTLCDQVREAFPGDAEALGCQEVKDCYEAETVINTVCDRIRYSVPTVSTAQFNCPVRGQNV